MNGVAVGKDVDQQEPEGNVELEGGNKA